MVKKIFGTIWTRIMIALMTLAVVVLNARYLGAANVGTISLIILSVTIVQTVNNFVGGGAIAYLVSRTPLVRLIIPGYAWALVTSLTVSAVLHFPGLIPEGYFIHVMVLSFIFSLASVNFMVLLGTEKISAYNLVSLLQVVLLLAVVLGFIFLSDRRDAMIYVYGMYVSYSFIFIAGFILIFPGLKTPETWNFLPVIREIFRYGTVMQLANIFQLFNYRLGIYLMEAFLGRAAVGIYSVGAQLSEGIWIIPRSISVVQFARISNANDPEYSARLTLNFIKLAVILSFLAVVILLLIPTSFFSLLFGHEFTGVRLVVATLAAGIIMLTISIILSSYYSGIGKPVHNMTGSAIGLVFTILLGLLLIPKLGIAGAGIAASVSYTSQAIYQLCIFIRRSGFKGKDFLLTRADITRVITEFRGMIRKEQ
jgi:O-antigen/teichoic acid export membrane protein